MSGADELILPPFLDEKIGPFGSFAPSQLVPYLEFRSYLAISIGAVNSQPQIQGNSNRYALLIIAPDTFAVQVSDRMPAAPVDYLFNVPAIQQLVFTFSDLGPIIQQPLWVTQSSVDGGRVYELIYTPRRCG